MSVRNPDFLQVFLCVSAPLREIRLQTRQSSPETSVVYFAEFEGYQRKGAETQRGRMNVRSYRSGALVAADVFCSLAVTGFQIEQSEDL
ncbi:MAG: hypothetical protein JWP89_3406 [Schlesneria sp.]|nr:hypothetical protein [Schlesneria sp.]